MKTNLFFATTCDTKRKMTLRPGHPVLILGCAVLAFFLLTVPHLGFRAEVREFWTGQPKFDFGAKLDHHQNLFAGGGIVFHF